MKFRNYCLVVMGETLNIVPEIVKIAETAPNILDAKGILIATFSSVAEPRELTDYFKLNGRNFLIFDLNSENSGYNITKDDINQGLFGFLKLMDEETLKQRTDDLIQEISGITTATKGLVSPNKGYEIHAKREQPEVSIEEIENMSQKDKNDLMNKLIDKGVKNLSNYDKELLNKLAI